MELFAFGPHLMIDGFAASTAKLEDESHIRNLLDALPAEMGMHKVLEPHVFAHGGSQSDDAGVTGVVIVAESHIAIHTFPRKRFVSVDVFSCKEFDAQQAVARIVEAFDVGRFETTFINRGKEYPKDLEAVERILIGEREYIEARVG